MKTRKILLIDLNLFFGGGQVYLVQLSRLLREEVDFYAFCINPKLKSDLRDLGVIAYGFDSHVRWSRLLHLLWAFWTTFSSRVRFGVDTVWINGIPDIVILPFARLLGCRTLATRHLTLDIEAQGNIRSLLRHGAEMVYRLCALATDKIICVSSAVADDLKTVVSPHKIVVIHNWQSHMPMPIDKLSDPSSPLRLLYVGRLQQYKGASLILEAMHQLKANATGGRDVSLTIVGNGRYREDLEAKAAGLDVTFAGFQGDTSKFYRSSDVFVNPTLGPEGMPLVSLEAMSYGLPCIFSDLKVHREITNDGMAALLFRSGQSVDLLSKLDLFRLSPEIPNLFGKRAREAILASHTAQIARSRYIQAIEF